MWDKVKSFLKGLISDIIGFFDPLAREIARNGGKLLLEAAMAAVIAAEQKGGSGEDKFKAAKATVIATLQSQSFPIVINAVHGALEAAVARMKESK